MPKAIAPVETGSIVLLNKDGDTPTPEHILAAEGTLGSEQVHMDAQTAPFLKLLQLMSPECNAQKDEYVEGASAGKLLITGSNTIMDQCYCMNVYLVSEAVAYIRQEHGGGFYGRAPTKNELEERIRTEGGNLAHHDVKDSHRHFVILYDMQGIKITPAVITMESTKIYSSNDWSNAINRLGKHRWASIWHIGVRSQTSRAGQQFYGYDISKSPVGWANPEAFKEGRELYRELARQFKTITPEEEAEAVKWLTEGEPA